MKVLDCLDFFFFFFGEMEKALFCGGFSFKMYRIFLSFGVQKSRHYTSIYKLIYFL